MPHRLRSFAGPRRLRRAAWLLAALALLSPTALAQDDPFGGVGDDPFGAGAAGGDAAGGDDPFGGPAAPGGLEFGAPQPAAQTPAAEGDALPADANIVVRMLREDPPQGLLGISRAVRLTSRLGEWAEAGRYLDQLAPLVTGPQESLQLVEAYGTDLWIQLSLRPELSEPQRTLAGRILSETAATRRAPETLQSALEGLQNPSAAERKRAALRIQAAGSDGLAALVRAIGDGTVPASETAVDVIDSFGRSGGDALAAAISTPDAARRNRLLYAATAFASRGLISQLAAGLFDADLDAGSAEAIRGVFQSRGRPLPTAPQARRFVLERLVNDLTFAATAKGDANAEPLTPTWFIAPDGGLQFDRVPQAAYHYQKAAEKAEGLLRMDPGVDQATVLAAAAVLQRDYIFAQASEAAASAEPLRLRTDEPLGGRARLLGGRGGDISLWVQVYRSGEVNRLHAAQLRAVQQLGTLAGSLPGDPEAVQTLLEAAESGVPAVRFVALEVLVRIESASGDPRVRAAVADARQSAALSGGGQPVSLVIGGADDLRGLLARQLGSLGIESLQASSGREAIRLIQQGQVIESVMIADRVRDMSLAQLAQRIAAYPPTSRLPIAILTPEITDGEAQVLRDEPHVVYGTLTNAADYILPFVRRLNRAASLPLPSREDRVFWAGMFIPASPQNASPAASPPAATTGTANP